MRTAAMVSSPAHARVTLKNLLLWLRVAAQGPARNVFHPLFDREFYLATYPDVKRSGVNPFLHFLLRGFLENRNPSELLESAHYLALYPDVKRARINPALHYALYGKRERRLPTPVRPRVIEVSAPGQHPEAGLRIDNAWPAAVPLVSVIIPCFNYGAYVEQALESVLHQTFRNFEVIVVEGGSTDGVTPRVVAAIEARGHAQVRVLHRSERHLVGDNRNYGISHARGRYICCLDADDLLKPVYLETAVFLAEAYGYGIVYGSVQCFGASDLVWTLSDANFPGILEGNQVATAALFRKDAWAAVGGYRDWGLHREHVPEDWDFWIRLLGRGYRAKSIREPMLRYRVHGEGLTATCGTDLAQQREMLRRENRELTEPLAIPPPAPAVIEIANRWTNLDAEGLAGRPAILIALPFLTIGGAEQLFQTIAAGFVARGYRVIATTSVTLPETMKDVPDRYDAITPHVYHLPRLLDAACHAEFILFLLRRYRVRGVLLAGSELFYKALPKIRAAFPGIAIADQQFNDTGHIANNRRCAAVIDRTIVPSRALADLLIQTHGESPDRVTVIPHGIETRAAFWNPEDAFRASGLPPHSRGKLLVSFFGRMSREKSPEVFVEVAARLADRGDLYFVMTGEGPEWHTVQQLAARRGLQDRLFLPGFVPDARPLMELSGIVVLTSSVDGMPLVVLEAQALGKPVVASSVGSLPEMVIQGETGFLCPPGDVQAFCEAIAKLADSEPLRRSFGERAREFVLRRYDSEAMVDAYVAALGLENIPPQSAARFDSVCNICGSRAFHRFAMRSDGVPVIACNHCGHCIVETFPYDLETLYQSDYFAAVAGSELGYSDFAYTAEHGVAWAAALIELLRPRGRVLDVGCADGRLLGKLPEFYSRFGIEFNPEAAGKAKMAGVRVIGSDILDSQLKHNWRESFDVLSAIAVFEHLPDFRGGIEAALALLKPGGVMLFEVPLITPDGQPDTWFRSSLEHIHYPTEQSIEYLFRNVLGLELAGKRLDIRNFAYTYIGISSKSPEVMARLAPEFERWVNAPPPALSPREARFRWLLELIHCGNPSPEVLALYRYANPADYNPLLIRRLFDVWMLSQHVHPLETERTGC